MELARCLQCFNWKKLLCYFKREYCKSRAVKWQHCVDFTDNYCSPPKSIFFTSLSIPFPKQASFSNRISTAQLMHVNVRGNIWWGKLEARTIWSFSSLIHTSLLLLLLLFCALTSFTLEFKRARLKQFSPLSYRNPAEKAANIRSLGFCFLYYKRLKGLAFHLNIQTVILFRCVNLCMCAVRSYGEELSRACHPV